MSRTKKKAEAFILPEHPNAEPHRNLMKRLETMSDDEFLQTLVGAGIYDKKGNLQAPYALEKTSPKKSQPKAVAARTSRVPSK